MNAQRKVLLVEDEVLVAALAVDALEELGYQTIEATTAKAAREIISGATEFTFAVIDVGLPAGPPSYRRITADIAGFWTSNRVRGPKPFAPAACSAKRKSAGRRRCHGAALPLVFGQFLIRA